MTTSRRNQSGAALVMFTVMLVLVVLPLVGLAIDGAILYLIRAKLSSAADAAALAGARSLSVGLDLDSQKESAKTTARNYFDANFPPGMLQTSGTVFKADVAETNTKTRTVGIDVTVTAPLYFMRILGYATSDVSAASQAARRDVNMILVLDRSGSMQSAGVCGTMIASAQNFVNRFANGRDRVGLITFNESSGIDYPPTLNFLSDTPSLPDVIAKLKCGGYTGSAEALWQAYLQILLVHQPGALNLIVFFTDGRPNGVTAAFPKKLLSDTRYDSYRTNTLVAMGPSNCAGFGPFIGTLAQGSGFGPTGYTAGLFGWVSVSNSDTQSHVAGSALCAFSSDPIRIRQDAAFMPLFDHNENSTAGYKNVDTFPSGSYYGQMRVDTPKAIGDASTNTADNTARRIRNDKTYSPIIYSIGLGGTDPGSPLDPEFLNRVANTPQSSSYDRSQLSGIYVYAPDASALSSAFQTVVSEILRLAR